MAAFFGVFWVAPKWIVVAYSMGVVADIVARRFMAPRFQCIFNFDVDAFTEVVECTVCHFGETAVVGIRHILASFFWLRGREGFCD